MYQVGGTLYVYLNYGLHHLLNIVTGPAGEPCAVLLRAGEPLWGHALMAKRRQRPASDLRLTVGPGNLTRALAVPLSWSGTSLFTNPQIQLLDDGYGVKAIAQGPRIGIAYAGPDAYQPWRFWICDSPYISYYKKNPNFALSHEP
jgi:DNA-3-methyladenine glycosylase